MANILRKKLEKETFTQSQKYFRIILTNQVKDLYNKIFNALKKVVKEDIRQG